MKIEKIFGKRVKFGKFSTESENFSETEGNLKQGGNASLPQRGWTPLAEAKKTKSLTFRTHDCLVAGLRN